MDQEETPTLATAREFIQEALGAFVHDPADSDFQAGYLAALYVIGTEALGMKLEGLSEPAAPRQAVSHLRVVK